MKIRALRGVCVGVDRHLKAGDSADLDTAMVTFLVSIKAVEIVKEEPPEAEPAKREAVKKESEPVPSAPIIEHEPAQPKYADSSAEAKSAGYDKSKSKKEK